MTTNNDKVIRSVQNWVESFVVGLNLCPFAKREVARGSIDFRVYEGVEPEDILAALRDAELSLSHFHS